MTERNKWEELIKLKEEIAYDKLRSDIDWYSIPRGTIVEVRDNNDYRYFEDGGEEEVWTKAMFDKVGYDTNNDKIVFRTMRTIDLNDLVWGPYWDQCRLCK
jgi:hypothetical protein